jgi:hypothetical protein
MEEEIWGSVKPEEQPIVFSVDRVNEMSGEEMEKWLHCPYLSMSTFLVIVRRMVLEMWKRK